MATKPKIKVPKSAKKGEAFQIKTLISHKMETGNRKGKDGKPIPRMILNKMTCSFNGTEVFSADMHPSVSANPYVTFYASCNESGKFDFTWTDDAGKTISASKKIKVA